MHRKRNEKDKNMPKKAIIPAGTSTPIAPFVPGSMADNILYVSGTFTVYAKTTT